MAIASLEEELRDLAPAARGTVARLTVSRGTRLTVSPSNLKDIVVVVHQLHRMKPARWISEDKRTHPLSQWLGYGFLFISCPAETLS